MILVAGALALGALATLVIGWFQSGLTMVYVSIGVSVLAAVAFVIGLLRSRTVSPATAGAPYGPREGTAEAATAPAEPKDRAKPRAPLPQRRPGARRPTGRPETAAPAMETVRSEETSPKPPATAEEPRREKPPAEKPSKSAAKKPAAKKPAAKKPTGKKSTRRSTARKPAAKKATPKPAAPSPRSRVISLPERGTFHRSGCRYIKGRRDTERITLGTAQKRGYLACGVCKPDAPR